MGTTERPLSGGCTADPALAARERVEGSGATSSGGGFFVKPVLGLSVFRDGEIRGGYRGFYSFAKNN